ncbi:MAG: macro domain-containing protein [Lachnospiraceae bacterium]|nr:macro domain-containing protein [Lachnospiraceae bacterium]
MSSIKIRQCGITDGNTECIVNAANVNLKGCGGVCGAVFRGAGWDDMEAICDEIGHCDVGAAVITPALRLRTKYVIHAVGPVWQGGGFHEDKLLYSAYRAALDLALAYGLHSVSLPLISVGNNGYPIEDAWTIGLRACADFLDDHPAYEIDLLFTIPDETLVRVGNFQLSRMFSRAKAQ